MKTEGWKLIVSIATIVGTICLSSGAVLLQQRIDTNNIKDLQGQVQQLHDDQIVMKDDIGTIKDTLEIAKSKGQISNAKQPVNYLAFARSTIAGASATPTQMPIEQNFTYTTALQPAPKPSAAPQPTPIADPQNPTSVPTPVSAGITHTVLGIFGL